MNLLVLETIDGFTYVQDLYGNRDFLPKNGFAIDEFIDIWNHSEWLAWQLINENGYGISC